MSQVNDIFLVIYSTFGIILFIFPQRTELEAKRKKDEEYKVMSTYFDLKCDWNECDITFDSLEMAKTHYWDCHRSTDFYIKCCDSKFKEPNLVRDHIAWHLNPDIFKCVSLFGTFFDFFVEKYSLYTFLISHAADVFNAVNRCKHENLFTITRLNIDIQAVKSIFVIYARRISFQNLE